MHEATPRSVGAMNFRSADLYGDLAMLLGNISILLFEYCIGLDKHLDRANCQGKVARHEGMTRVIV